MNADTAIERVARGGALAEELYRMRAGAPHTGAAGLLRAPGPFRVGAIRARAWPAQSVLGGVSRGAVEAPLDARGPLDGLACRLEVLDDLVDATQARRQRRARREYVLARQLVDLTGADRRDGGPAGTCDQR